MIESSSRLGTLGAKIQDKTVLKRLNVYHEQTKPLTDFYKNLADKGILIFYKVDGSESVETVFKNISDNL